MRILIIDDDNAMLELMEIMLEPLTDNIFIANTGTEGISMGEKMNPDLIILDLVIPDVDGWQICREIRKFSDVPILILSALDSPAMIANALDAGADDYLIKPVTKNMLQAHINKLLRRTEMKNHGVRLMETRFVSNN